MKKQRHKSFSPLLAVALLAVCVGWLGVRTVNHQQQRIISMLAERLELGAAEEAVAALRQMAHLEASAVGHIVKAAADSRHRVAQAARRTVEGLVTKWKREAESAASARQTGHRLERLAVALAAELANFSAEGKIWARARAEDILYASSVIPPGDRLTLVRNCEAVLRETAEIVVTSVAGSASGETEPTADSRSEFPLPTTDAAPRLLPMETVAQPTALPNEKLFKPTELIPLPTASDSQQPARQPLGDERQSLDGFADMPPPDWPTRWSDEQPHQLEITEGPSKSVDAATRKHFVGAREPVSEAADELTKMPTSKSTPAAAPPAAKPPDVDVRELTALQLVKRLAEADSVRRQVDEELDRRGYGRLPPPLAIMLASEDASQREQAVEALLRAPGIKPTLWLMILADDASADVRLAVVSLFATSDDPVLVDKAWDVAIHDRDPRISALTTPLRTKREGRFRE